MSDLVILIDCDTPCTVEDAEDVCGSPVTEIVGLADRLALLRDDVIVAENRLPCPLLTDTVLRVLVICNSSDSVRSAVGFELVRVTSTDIVSIETD